MLKTLFAPVAAAFVVLLFAGSADPTQAAGRGGHSYSGGNGGVRSYSAGPARSYGAGPRVSGRYSGSKSQFAYKSQHAYKYAHRHRHIGRGIIVGVPYGVYAYSEGCTWLRHKASVTGSSYWWNRYYACLDGNYYD